MSRRIATWVAFGPSLAAGLAGAIWWALDPPSLTPTVALWPSLALGAATGGLLLGAAWWLERNVPSFAWVARATERALARLSPSRTASALLAVGTSLGEELLFRGMLLDAVGLVPQALLFGALHPAGRRGWSYPLFVAASGLALGAVVVVTGRLAPAVLAHLIVNGVGLLSTPRSGPRPR